MVSVSLTSCFFSQRFSLYPTFSPSFSPSSSLSIVLSSSLSPSPILSLCLSRSLSLTLSLSYSLSLFFSHCGFKWFKWSGFKRLLTDSDPSILILLLSFPFSVLCLLPVCNKGSLWAASGNALPDLRIKEVSGLPDFPSWRIMGEPLGSENHCALMSLPGS